MDSNPTSSPALLSNHFPGELPDGTKNISLGSGIITSMLGEGGVAIVYEIWNERLGIKRAVKLLRPNSSKESKRRFETEMKLLAQLRHPNIIEIHAVGEWNTLPYIEMERIYGHSLGQLVKQYGALPAHICTSIGIMICRALSFTHNHEYKINGANYKGILHRDLKPANIMISKNGLVKLMDFGIATPTHVSMHTVEGTVVGSLSYISPEQISGKDSDGRTDIYSFGCVLYEMITGRKAFPQRLIADLVPAKMKNFFTPLHEYQLKIPRKLRNLITKCMAFQKEKRFDDSVSLLVMLESIHNSLTSETPEKTLENFLGNKGNEKNVISFRKSARMVLFGILAIIISFGTYFGVQKALTRKNQTTFSIENSAVVPSVMPLTNNTHESISNNIATKPIATPERSKQKPMLKPDLVKTSRVHNISLMDSLSKLYGTNDIQTIFIRELRESRHSTVLKLFDSLSPSQSQSAIALLGKMKSLKALGLTQQLSAHLINHNVADQEWSFFTARMHFENGKFEKALEILESSKSFPSQLGDAEIISREMLFYKALCLTKLYEKYGGQELKEKALFKWFDIKNLYQTQRTHEYFSTAQSYIRQLSQSNQSGNSN